MKYVAARPAPDQFAGYVTGTHDHIIGTVRHTEVAHLRHDDVMGSGCIGYENNAATAFAMPCQCLGRSRVNLPAIVHHPPHITQPDGEGSTEIACRADNRKKTCCQT